jgi:hypothetical protein
LLLARLDNNNNNNSNNSSSTALVSNSAEELDEKHNEDIDWGNNNAVSMILNMIFNYSLI